MSLGNDANISSPTFGISFTKNKKKKKRKEKKIKERKEKRELVKDHVLICE